MTLLIKINQIKLHSISYQHLQYTFTQGVLFTILAHRTNLMQLILKFILSPTTRANLYIYRLGKIGKNSLIHYQKSMKNMYIFSIVEP